MLTLALLLSLQQTPITIDANRPPVTREAVKRGTSAGRFAAMTGIWFGAVFTTAAVGIIPGALLGATGGSLSAVAGGLIGGFAGAGLGALMSPLLMWGVSRGLDGKGSLAATWLGTLLGIAVCATLTIGAVYSYSSPGASLALGIAAGVSAPLVILGGPIAYSISHAINAAEAEQPVALSPTLVPLKDGVLAGVSMTF